MRYRPIRRNGEFGRVYARGKSYVNQALVLYAVSYTHLDVYKRQFSSLSFSRPWLRP